METTLEYHRYLRDLKLLFHLQLYKTIMGDRSVTNIFLSVHTFPPDDNYSMGGRGQLEENREASAGQATDLLLQVALVVVV